MSAYARTTDPDTAHEAAARVRPSASSLENIVLGAVIVLGSATSHEVAEFTGLDLVSVSPRFRPLELAGLLERTGERRRTPNGGTAQVWAPRKRQEVAA